MGDKAVLTEFSPLNWYHFHLNITENANQQTISKTTKTKWNENSQVICMRRRKYRTDKCFNWVLKGNGCTFRGDSPLYVVFCLPPGKVCSEKNDLHILLANLFPFKQERDMDKQQRGGSKHCLPC